MKKLTYQKPFAEIIEFEFEGVIAASYSDMNDLPSDPGRTDISVQERTIWDNSKWLE